MFIFETKIIPYKTPELKKNWDNHRHCFRYLFLNQNQIKPSWSFNHPKSFIRTIVPWGIGSRTPLWIPQSMAAQVPYIKYHSIWCGTSWREGQLWIQTVEKRMITQVLKRLGTFHILTQTYKLNIYIYIYIYIYNGLVKYVEYLLMAQRPRFNSYQRLKK